MQRRDFLKIAGLAGLGASFPASATPNERPNILWLSAEDISPLLGCYGDDYAVTPNLDRLAAQGVTYDRAYAPVPVCSPSRSCAITGVHCVTLGTSHHRSAAQLPPDLRCFPAYLRDAGYYCTNNKKKDYNFQEDADTWDASSPRAHWRDRPDGQPFFAVINHTVCHESILHRDDKTIEKMRRDHNITPHDPAKVTLPKYHPDLPEMRADWALYYDGVTAMDDQVGQRLRELEEAGLAEDTIVVFWGDHGTGMPRGKRWIHESGTRVPLIVRVPEKWQHLAPGKPGSRNSDFVTFQDFAPTMLALAGAARPDHLQGRAFFGAQEEPAPEYLYLTRDRLDEACDTVRAIRWGKYRYIRNFLPHVPYDQHNMYLYKAKSMRAWQDAAPDMAGHPALLTLDRKPLEELYDVEADPDEVNNLVNDPAHRETLERLRKRMNEAILAHRDTGLLAEAQLAARTENRPAYTFAHDQDAFDVEKILKTANMPVSGASTDDMIAACADKDDAVRYWGVVSLLAMHADGDPVHEGLTTALEDPSPSVRVVAAEALCACGQEEKGIEGLIAAAEAGPEYARIRALNALERQGAKATPVIPRIEALQESKEAPALVHRAAEAALVRLKT
jgi:arylsulfatase A-like enzyme